MLKDACDVYIHIHTYTYIYTYIYLLEIPVVRVFAFPPTSDVEFAYKREMKGTPCAGYGNLFSCPALSRMKGREISERTN